MKEIKKEIVWHLDEPGNHPPFTGWLLVSGTAIEKGRMYKTTRVVHHAKGNGYTENNDMQVEFWAELPFPTR